MDLFLKMLEEISQELVLQCEAKRGGLQTKFTNKASGKSFYFLSNNLPINNVVACRLAIDKALCTEVLNEHSIPCVQHIKLTSDVFNELPSSPVLDLYLKPNRGKGGSNVHRVRGKKELAKFKEKLYHTKTWCYSHTEKYDIEYRVTVLDDQCVSIYGKTKAKSGQNNLSHGAKAFMVEAEKHKELIEVAIKASNVLGLRFSNVDMFYDKTELPKVMEVNSSVCLKKVLYMGDDLYNQCKTAYSKAFKECLKLF